MVDGNSSRLSRSRSDQSQAETCRAADSAISLGVVLIGSREVLRCLQKATLFYFLCSYFQGSQRSCGPYQASEESNSRVV